LKAAIAAVAKQIDLHALQKAYTADPAVAVVPAERVERLKRRRVDEDLKFSVTTAMLQDGRATSTAVAARGLGLGRASKKWDNAESLRYQAACWRIAAERVQALCVALDGKRLGQPAEETEVIACWLYPQDVACWAPPMVPR
jgi:hypothetical protein